MNLAPASHRCSMDPLERAFRVTYGFGFLYDRNFASEENNRGRLR